MHSKKFSRRFCDVKVIFNRLHTEGVLSEKEVVTALKNLKKAEHALKTNNNKELRSAISEMARIFVERY